MVDLHFQDVVEVNSMIGPPGRYAVGICKSCSERHKVTADEFDLERLFNLDGTPANHSTQEDRLYVAKMRAWNCCHEGEEPIGGLPEPPEDTRYNYE